MEPVSVTIILILILNSLIVLFFHSWQKLFQKIWVTSQALSHFTAVNNNQRRFKDC